MKGRRVQNIRRKCLKLAILASAVLLFSIGGASAGAKTIRRPPALADVGLFTYSQQMRKDYIGNYLKEEYGLDCTISDVRKKSSGANSIDQLYYADAETDNGNTISVWVSEQGQIYDTVFLTDMQEEIREYIRLRAKQIMPEYRVSSYTEFTVAPSEEQRAGIGVTELLHSPGVYTYIRVLIPADAPADIIEMEKQAAQFSDISGTVYFYVGDDEQLIQEDPFCPTGYLAAIETQDE